MKEGRNMSYSTTTNPGHQRSRRSGVVAVALLVVLAMLALTPIGPASAKTADSTGLDGAFLIDASQNDAHQYSVKAVIAEHTADYIDVGILIKTEAGSERFPISEQNYRLRYDDSIFDFYESAEGGSQDPYIIREDGHLSGLVQQDGQPNSFYAPQTVTGSSTQTPGEPPTISLNLVLEGGPGYLLTESWYEVGKIRLFFDQPSNEQRQVTVHWNTDDDYPPTFVGVFNPTNGMLETADGLYFYGIHELSPTDICCSVPTSSW